MTHFPNNNFYNQPYENTTFQVNMLDANTGMLVNQSIPFRKQQDVNNYLLHMSNLMPTYKLIVMYQTLIWTHYYHYQIYTGCYEFKHQPEYNFPSVPTSTHTSTHTSTNGSASVNGNGSGIVNDNGSGSENESRKRMKTEEVPQSGFNFHFDPPTTQYAKNNNYSWTATNLPSTVEQTVEQTGTNANNHDEYTNNNLDVEDSIQFEEHHHNMVNNLLMEIEDTTSSEPNMSTATLENPIESWINPQEPPPVDEDYWNVVQSEEDYSEFKLEKYGRGYLLSCDEDHPDYGVKYYPDNDNCLAWWQEVNSGWFVKRENKNYFLEKGANFIH